MEAYDIMGIMADLHDVFPLPESDTFRGSHNITIQTVNDMDYVTFGIWYEDGEGQIRIKQIYFDLHEEINLDAFESAKRQFFS